MSNSIYESIGCWSNGLIWKGFRKRMKPGEQIWKNGEGGKDKSGFVLALGFALQLSPDKTPWQFRFILCFKLEKVILLFGKGPGRGRVNITKAVYLQKRVLNLI